MKKIVSDVLDKNLNNPRIGHHFRHVDMPKLKQLVFEFFSMGTGGPHDYTGRDLESSHSNLGITQTDFDIANEDTIAAMNDNHVPQAEQKEVLDILNSLKGQIIRK